MNHDPSVFYLEEYDRIQPALAFSPEQDFLSWREQVRAKLTQLLGIPPKRTDASPVIEYTDNTHPDYDEIRFSFESEPGYFVPCHLLLPKIKDKVPAVICLQGHTTGMHISLGRTKFDGDEHYITGGDRDFAISAVKRGYAALALEQRSFGETVQHITHSPNGGCHHPSMQALLLGRTMVGDRVFDVMRAVDALEHFTQLDLSCLGIMGNSGGGTISYYAAAMEPRIRLSMPSCAFCTFQASIFSLFHCQCNYVPGILQYMEMYDIVGLIAPRPLVIVAGLTDPIFPYEHVQKAFTKVQAIYTAAGAPEHCVLVTGGEGHRFYAEQGWAAYGLMMDTVLKADE